MSALNSNDKLAELVAREEIRDLLNRYSHAIDRRDWQAFADVFWPDGLVEYGLYNDVAVHFGPIVEQVYIDSRIDISQHFLGNCIIRVEGSTAYGETYVHALHRVPNDDGTYRDVIMGCRYLDTFECRHGDWRISHRKVAFDWFREFPDSGDYSVGAFGIQAGNAYIGHPGADAGVGITAALSGRTVASSGKA